MELQYEKALKENNLKISDLPEDAQIGIDNINDVLKGVRMLEKKGKTMSDKTLKKIKAMDKWVYYEILDHVAGTDENEEVIPHKKEEVLDEIKATEKGAKTEKVTKSEAGAKVEKTDGVEVSETTIVGDPKGEKIDADLKVAFEAGKTKITMEELKTVSKTAYDVIFDSYDESGDNGIETSNYTLLETSENEFTLTKK